MPRITGLLSVAIMLALPSTAEAHLAVEGVGEVVNGALHPFVSPAHVLIFLGLGILLGQQVPMELKTPIRVFAPVSALALLLTMSGFITAVYPPVLIAIALGIAVFVVMEKKMAVSTGALICGVAATGIGLDSGVETGSTFEILKTLAGTWLALNAAVFYIAACASHSEGRQWARTGIRIAGSWIIAISLMVLAFFFRR